MSKVPLVWYTGNAQGRMSAAALASNNGQTADVYQKKWLEAYEQQQAPGAATAQTSQGQSTTGAQVAEGTKPAAPARGDTNATKISTQSGITLEGVDSSVISGLNSIQQGFNKNLVVSSGVRTTPTAGVQGNDPHQQKKAVDISYRSSGIDESDAKKLVQLALDNGFTGIGVEGTHLHLDTSHPVKTLWGDDWHFGSAPEWAKSMTDWGNVSGASVASASRAGSDINSKSIVNEAAAMTAKPAQMAMQQPSQQNSRYNIPASNVKNNNKIGEVPIAARLESLVA